MGSEIERIVDRKTIRNRVHYLVVWRGFGEESNTWESRMDLVADGYSNVIRDYENSRKDGEGEDAASTGENKTPSRSPSRGRSPGRGKSPAKSAAAKTSTSTTSTSSSTSTTGTGRPRGRPRSNSATRSPSASRGKRSSSKSRDGESVRRRSSKKETKELSTTTNGDSTTTTTTTVVEKTTLTVSDDSSVLRETLTALSERAPVARAAAESPVNGETKSTVVQLAYESVTATTASLESPKKQPRSEAIATEPPALRDLWLKLNEGNWLLGFVSVVVVAGSLLASQLLPPSERTPVEISPALGSLEAAARVGQWRQWLPFLTPLVALLLVFHQRDRRAFVKWIAIALAWRIAAELSIFFEFVEVATGAAGVAYTALLVVLVLIARSDDLRSKSTLAAFVVGALLLALSDSWIAQTNNVVLPSRVNLMSGSVLLVALSPRFTATPDED